MALIQKNPINILEFILPKTVVDYIFMYNPDHRPKMERVFNQLFFYHHKKIFQKIIKRIKYKYFINTIRNIQKFINENINLIILEPSNFPS
jgi:hypothetical protein